MYNKFYLDLRDFRNTLKSKNYSPRTIDNYELHLSNFLKFTDKPRSHISLVSAEKYMLYIKDKSYSKKNQAISSIKLYYKFILNKELKTNKIERPRKEKRLPQIIDKQFLLLQISKIKNLKHKAVISLGYSVGLRVSEVINLKIKDVDSKRMIITIRQAKGRKDRIVPLSQGILLLLRTYFKQHKPIEYLFNGQKELRYSATSCNKIVKKYLGQDAHFHLLRHSAFTHLTEQGVDIRAIQKLAGHASSKTTEIYAQVSTQVLHNLPLAI